jgi:hypothetical protein
MKVMDLAGVLEADKGARETARSVIADLTTDARVSAA